jgi:two-component system CheB/CheR fusion protein
MNGTALTDLIDPEYRLGVLARVTGLGGENTGSFHASHHDLPPDGSTPAPSPTDPLDGVLVFRLRRADGTRRSVEMVTAHRRNGSVLAVLRPVSVTTDLVEKLRESRNNYDALSETITEAILRLDEDLRIVFANSAVKTTFGYAPDELHGRHFSVLFPASVFRRNEESFRKYFVVDDQDRTSHGLSNTFEILGHHRHRGVAPMEISFGNSKDFRGRTLTCIIRDITQHKNAERRLRHLAYHDQLTGLGNRDLFESHMNRLFQQPGAFEAGPATLMFLDLDGFKQVNDTLGHDVGDDLLVQTGKRLVKALRETDSVYRFGGDEFVVLLNFVRDRRGASVVAHTILAEIRRPYTVVVSGDTEGTTATVSVGVSIGISMLPEHGSTITGATKTADLAMYSSKEAGKNRFTFYDPSMDQRAHDRWHLEQGIRTSLERQEFQMYYQPLVDIDGGILGYEALLRWDSPGYGTVSPRRFIAIAEETGLIVPLGAWAMETAFHDAVTWVAPNGNLPYISVNLSPKQFERADLLTTLTNVINRTQIDPGRVIIEVTETSVMSAPEASIATLEALKTRFPDMLIAIDDFGTGYSSLSYLTRLPVDIIKIDLSFVSRLFIQNNEKIVQAILNLGESLGIKVVAEGVETPEQRDFFVDKGCFAVQGYHFYRPVAAAEAPGLLV